MNSVLDTGFNEVPAAPAPTKLQFDPAQLLHMCQLQDEANTAMSSEAWRDSTDDTLWYYRAINNELAELATHIGIKWWKNEHPTDEIRESAFAQARMEVVDILHFTLSYMIRDIHLKMNKPLDEVVNALPALQYPVLVPLGRFAGNDAAMLNTTYDTVTINDFVEQCQFVALVNAGLPLNYLTVLAEMLGFTSQELYVSYVAKNILNKFRTANGQREGMYFKIWDGVEDNEYLTLFLNNYLESNDQPPSVDAVIEYLTGVYANHLDQGTAERG